MPAGRKSPDASSGTVALVARKKAISDAKLALYNRLQREKFRAVPPGERVLFLPHCLRKPKGCRSENSEEGLICKHCSPDCAINNLSTYAVSRGYRCYIVPGGEMLFNIVEKTKPRAIIGVACHHEMGQAAERITGEESSVDFAYQGVPLSKSGCIDTKVDLDAVKAVIDLQGPPPAGPSSPVSAFSPRRSMAWRVGGMAAATVVALVALMLFVPPLLAPGNGTQAGGAPDIISAGKPTASPYKDPHGDPMAQVSVSVYNDGGDTRGVQLQASSYYCSVPFDQSQIVAVNGSLQHGATAIVVLQVGVHDINDTSITIESRVQGKWQILGSIPAPKTTFLRDMRDIRYSPALPSGKQANLTVEVFSGGPRSAGSLKVDVSSYSSFNKNIHFDSTEVTLDRPLARNETWSFTVLLNVNEIDPGHPTFVAELFENSGASPTDSLSVDG